MTCLNAFSTDFYCTDEDGDQTSSYGGGYVLKTPESGVCVLLQLYAYSTSSNGLLRPANSTASDSSTGSPGSVVPAKFNVTNGPVSIHLTPDQRAAALNNSQAVLSTNVTQVNGTSLFNETVVSKLLNGSTVVIERSS